MAGSLELVKTVTGTSSAAVDVTDCFSADYDVYKVTIYNKDASSGAFNQNLRLLDSGGTAITDTEYDVAILLLNSASSFTESRATSDNRFYQFLGYNLTVGGGNSQGATAYIHNPYDSSSYTFVKSQSGNNGGNLVGMKYIGVHKVAEQITGIQLKSEGFSGTTTFESGTTSIYGVK